MQCAVIYASRYEYSPHFDFIQVRDSKLNDYIRYEMNLKVVHHHFILGIMSLENQLKISFFRYEARFCPFLNDF